MRLFDWFKSFGFSSPGETPDLAMTRAKQAHKKGVKAYDKADYRRALALFEEALRLQPALETSQEMLGSTLLRLGRFEEALVAFEKLRQLDHERVNSWSDTWLAFLGLGRYPDAVRALDRSLRLLVAPAVDFDDENLLCQLVTRRLEISRTFPAMHGPLETEQLDRGMARVLAKARLPQPKRVAADLEARVWFDLNTCLRACQRFDGAEEALRTAAQRWQRLGAETPRDVGILSRLAGCHNSLGTICEATGRPRVVRESFLLAVTLREAVTQADPADLLNQLHLVGALCNLGHLTCEEGDIPAAKELLERAIRLVQPLRRSLKENQHVEQFLRNCQHGLKRCQLPALAGLPPLHPIELVGPEAALTPLQHNVTDTDLANRLSEVDALRLAGDPGASRATADLVAQFPECAEAWLLRGLALGHIQPGPNTVPIVWDEERHEAAMEAYYEALACHPEHYEVLLAKGRELRQAAHVSQVQLQVFLKMTESLPLEERERQLNVPLRRYKASVIRGRESLEAATRVAPRDVRAWYHLAELNHGLGFDEEVATCLAKLREVDATLWAEVRDEFGQTPEE
jgi:tetratricopeptide (TPR) repeat protein